MEKEEFNLSIEEMAGAGLHFGRKTSKLHPKMQPFISGIKNTIHIINLEKTREKLIEALDFIKSLILENKIILFVGTKIQFKDLIKDFATQLNFPYVNHRWLGGTFTNFEVIKRRVEHLKNLKKLKESEEFQKYTKKERAKIEKEINKLELKFGGLENLERLPDAVFVLDLEKDVLAAKEAKRKGVKVIAISNTHTDPTLADYFIPANNNAISSVKYILSRRGLL
jgi:small subunit ribosomal protein S2